VALGYGGVGLALLLAGFGLGGATLRIAMISIRKRLEAAGIATPSQHIAF
jgi:hypothetical protein